jgi:hypothetical protein
MWNSEGYGFFTSVKPSRQQLLCYCRSACGEDRAFEDDGEPVVWLEPLDRRE